MTVALPAESVFAAFCKTAAAYPDHEFLHIPASACTKYAPAAISMTYAEAVAEVKILASHFADAGVGARVALLLENRPGFFLNWLALNALGVSVVPISSDYRPAEISYILIHSEADLVISIPEKVPDVHAAVEQTRRNVAIVVPEAIKGGLKLSRPSAPRSAASETECALLYTSGTTGRPKGCLLSNEYFLRMGLRYINRKGYIAVEPGRARVLTPLPMFHMNAMASSTMGMILAGGCVIQLDRFHPKSWWHDVRVTGATGIHYLGVMPAILLDMPVSPDERAHRVRYGVGANVEPKHHAAFEARFGFSLIEGWSMTETGAGAAMGADHEPRHVGTRCFGRVPPTLSLRLTDDAGNDVAQGEPGEMWVRHAGPDPMLGFFTGYLKDPEATASGWAGGWWHTGDIARMGPDGSLHFVDRRKNIRRSGENISAMEVEAALQKHPYVSQVAVTAVADPMRGEEVMACIVPIGASTLTEAEDILHWSLAQIAYFKVPGWIAFMTELPKTATQKIQRNELRETAERLISHSAAFDLRQHKRRSSEAKERASDLPC